MAELNSIPLLACSRNGKRGISFVCVWGFMAIMTALVMCARSQDSLTSVSMRMVRVVFSTAGFKGGRKQSPKTRATAAQR